MRISERTAVHNNRDSTITAESAREPKLRDGGWPGVETAGS